MTVDRCVCLNVPFSEMLSLRAQGVTFTEIQERTGCCSGCGMCEPYVRLALATGKAELPVLRGRDLARAWAVDPDAADPAGRGGASV